MSGPFPATISTPDGRVLNAGGLSFPDPDNQPASAAVPFTAPAGSDTPVLVTSADTALVKGGGDTNGVVLLSTNQTVDINMDAAATELDGRTTWPAVVMAPDLPTADPHIDGSLWSDGGVVTLSVGP